MSWKKNKENMARKQTQVLTLEEKLEDARTKNKALEKKISRKDVDIFKLESEIQSLMDCLRNKEGQMNMLRFAPPFVPIPIRKRSVETNTETLHLTEASSQTETKTQRTHEGQNHHTRSSANQQCHARVNVSRQSYASKSYRSQKHPRPSPHTVPIYQSPQMFQTSGYYARF